MFTRKYVNKLMYLFFTVTHISKFYFIFQYVPFNNDDYKKPFFLAYTKASMFTIYFLVYIIFKELRKPCEKTNYMVITIITYEL